MCAAKKKAPEAEESRPAGPVPPPRLRTRYQQEILPALATKLGARTVCRSLSCRKSS